MASPPRGVGLKRAYVPPCPHYPGGCRAGCAWIDVPYPEQLRRKQKIVADALSTYASLRNIEVPPVVASPKRLGYRARVKLVARRARGEVLAGLYRPESHEVVDISRCPVHPEPVDRVVQYLKREVERLGIAPYDERSDGGDLRYIDIRYSFFSREIVLTLVTRHANFPRGQELARALTRRFGFIAGVAQNINEDPGNVIWGPRTRMLAGRDTVIERIGDWKLRFPVGVFSQANPLTARKLYEKTRDLAALSGNEIVLDVYCGVGPIALYLAPAAELVWGVDDSALAIATAKQNARMNGVANCRFFAADAAEKIAEAKNALPRVDLAVVNPPRKGLQPDAAAALLDLGPPRIVYVSCNPETLARDLDQFAQKGWRVSALQPFDMFPQTDQVETVALFLR
ncbi:MAG TPA: 23S rRNA (uracil(1939)-C(5))-methyltransferase RlmD [Candidatus Binatia bacterium]|nr:23S rRNA (uracil(1939)-C(5))-methyltransferase RlmD [Candidatus Binatia bacterium]